MVKATSSGGDEGFCATNKLPKEGEVRLILLQATLSLNTKILIGLWLSVNSLPGWANLFGGYQQ